MEERIKAILGAAPKDRFLSTASAEDSASQVYLSTYIDFMRQTGRNHFLIRDEQFMLGRLELLGCALKTLPVNERGQVTTAILEEVIKPRAALVSLPWADALTGVIHPIADLAQLCHDKDVRFHVDATEVIGKIFFRFQDLPVDFLSFDGGLLIKEGTEFVGQAHPNDHILDTLERELESFDHFCTEAVRLRDRLERGIREGVPDAKVLFGDAERLPHISAIEFPGVGSETLLYHLHRQGFALKEAGKCAISFRLNEHTTQEEIDRLIAAAVSAAKQLRALSCDLETAEEVVEFRGSEESMILNQFARDAEQSGSRHRGHTLESSRGDGTAKWLKRAILPGPGVLQLPLYSKKLKERIDSPRAGGFFTEEEAERSGMRLAVGREGKELALYLLVDLSDGVIADVKFQAFGHTALIGAADVACELLLRKNYDQALRISAELIDRHLRDKGDAPAFPSEVAKYLNAVIDAIEKACEQCRDIPFADTYVAPPMSLDDEVAVEYPGWPGLSTKQKITVIEEVIASDIRPYIQLDAGDVKVLNLLEDKEVIIAYSGACTSCYSSTGATLNAIQQILRMKVHPHLVVTPNLTPE